MIAPSRGGGQSHTRWASIRLVDRLTRRQGAPAHGAVYALKAKAMAQMMLSRSEKAGGAITGRQILEDTSPLPDSDTATAQ